MKKGYYKLTVRQLREDVTDQNIVIEDKLETQGASIVKDSIFCEEKRYRTERCQNRGR